jgi:hypothetical protein
MRDEVARNAQSELIGIDVKLKHRTLVGMRPFKHFVAGDTRLRTLEAGDTQLA